MKENISPDARDVQDSTATNRTCSCAHYDDGSVHRSLCPLHADQDPCLTMARVTGRRRKGSIVKGICTRCSWAVQS